MASQGITLYNGIEISEHDRAFLDRSSVRIANMDKSVVNNKTVTDVPSSGLRKNQDRMGRRWAMFVAGHPRASVNCVDELQDFMLMVATGVKGRKGDDYYFNESTTSEDEDEEDEKGKKEEKELRGSYQYVRNCWNHFCGWCKRMGFPISSENKEVMTKYNKHFLQTEVNLRPSAREAKFASEFHFRVLAVSTFRRCYVVYCKPRVRIVHWTMTSAYFFGSARIGEFAKSSARDDSRKEKRGLFFKEAHMFAMFNKNKGKTELCIRFTKDEKGKGDTPQERGQVTFYEDMEGPLYENCFLFCLVILLARMPFRDYQSLDRLQLLQKLLDIEIKEEQRFSKIHWKKEFRDKPFFECPTNDSGDVEKAKAVHRRHKESCYRAGLPNAPNFHDFRRKGLNNADGKNSESSRMRLGGHVKPGIFRKHYQPRETIDGAANFLGREQRTDVLEVSQELNIPYIPNLLQSLPAKELHKVQHSREYQELQERIDEETCIREANKLQRKLESLKLEKLKRLRASQAYDDPPSYEHEIYSRVRFMLSPERRRLEANLFEEVPLRSTIGMQVVKDLLTLYFQDKEVEFRPGLEPTLCSCSKKSHSYDWRHILNCRKASQTKIHGFAELCFLCNIWIYNGNEWERHCQRHIDSIALFPVWVDPLVYDGVLAVAGFCEFCLIDTRLPASERMRQWTWRHTWQEHYQAHYQDPKFERKCRHQSFSSLLELQFHLHDRHGVPMPEASRQSKRRKRREQERAESYPARNRKRPRTRKKEEQEEKCIFLNSTVDSIALSLAEQCPSKSSPRLLSSDPDFVASQTSLNKCSSYPDIALADSGAASGPYYTACDAPKLEYFGRGFSSQLAPTNPISNIETEYIDTDNLLVDSAIELESASTTKQIKEELEIVDLAGGDDDKGNDNGVAFLADSDLDHTNDNGLSHVHCTSQASVEGPGGGHRMALLPDPDKSALVDLTGDSEVLETAVMSVARSDYIDDAKDGILIDERIPNRLESRREMAPPADQDVVMINVTNIDPILVDSGSVMAASENDSPNDAADIPTAANLTQSEIEAESEEESKPSRRQHKRYHVKPYACEEPVCLHENVRFSTRRALNRHQASVHRGTSFKCPFCGEQIKRKDNLNRHIKRWHNGVTGHG